MNRHSMVMVILALTACGGAANASPPKTHAVSSSGTATPLTATGTGATGQPPAAMGVEAKRKMKHFQDDILPKAIAKFKANCGFEVAVDVDWESFGNDAGALSALSSNRGLDELNEAFHAVCKDQIGKDGVKSKIKRIAYKNIPDRANKKMVLEDGVFKLDLAFDLKALIEGTFPSSAYRSYLEKQL